MASHARLHIPVHGNVGNPIQIRVFDLSGRMVQSVPVAAGTGAFGHSDLELSTNGLDVGVYMVRIQDGPSIHSVPFVVSH